MELNIKGTEYTVVTENESFTHVVANEGFYFTKFKEGDDIKTFSCHSEMYLPKNAVIPEYTIITEEQKLSNEAKCIEAFETK